MRRGSGSVEAVSVLSDATRRRLYEFIRGQARPVSRDEAAEHAGISRKLAAFHLDKLARSGLLRSHYTRPEGAAPRPGRAPKVYEPADVELEVTIPPRQYEFVGEVLLDAVEAARAAPSRDVAAAALGVAAERGEELGAACRTASRGGRIGAERALGQAAEVLGALGYEPARRTPDLLCLRNCPFHRLATRSPELVCGINHAFVAGVLRGLGAGSVEAALVPSADHCCVEVRRQDG